jgi:hypothetical protein
MAASKASGTVAAYSHTARRFEDFCHLHGHPFPYFSSEAVTHFVVHQDIRQSGYTFLSTIKPALSFLEAAMNRPTALTPTIDLLLSGAKRRARARAGPAKKTPPLHPENLATVISAVFPIDDTIGLANPVEMRTAFRSLIEYHTLCRFSCFNKLKAKHFELIDDDIMITFPTAKNDQLHKGQHSCLAATPHSALCPVRITKLYFRRFQLKFGAAAKDESFVNFQLRRQTCHTIPILHKTISPSSAKKDLQTLLAKHDIPHEGITDKAPKMTGVTEAFEAGATETEVMHGGRWKTSHIPLRYKLNSHKFKRSIALKIPPLDRSRP